MSGFGLVKLMIIVEFGSCGVEDFIVVAMTNFDASNVGTPGNVVLHETISVSAVGSAVESLHDDKLNIIIIAAVIVARILYMISPTYV